MSNLPPNNHVSQAATTPTAATNRPNTPGCSTNRPTAPVRNTITNTTALAPPPSPQKPLVSTEEWIIGINDILSHKTSTSLWMLYPNLWKVVTKVCDHWLQEKWEVAVKSKNKTNFKTKVAKQVISMRQISRLTTVPAALRDLYPDASSKSHVYVLELDSFLEHADTHYKVNRAASDERMLANVNDKI